MAVIASIIYYSGEEEPKYTYRITPDISLRIYNNVGRYFPVLVDERFLRDKKTKISGVFYNNPNQYFDYVTIPINRDNLLIFGVVQNQNVDKVIINSNNDDGIYLEKKIEENPFIILMLPSILGHPVLQLNDQSAVKYPYNK